MTNLQGYTNWVADADIKGGTLVSINDEGKAVNTSATTKMLFGVAINDCKQGDVVAVKVSYPIAQISAIAGAYTAGAKVYLDASGKITATGGAGKVEAGWFVGATITTKEEQLLDIAVCVGAVVASAS